MTRPSLNIRLLGEFALSYAGQPVTTLTGDRPQSLLAYLLLHRHAPQPRRQIAFLLWPDTSEAQARSNLRNLVFTLRHGLPNADQFLAADSATLSWRADAPYDLDVARFEHALQRARQGDLAARSLALEEAIAAYQGDLLPGNYDDWILPIREQLRQSYVEALEAQVAVLEARGEYGAAIRASQRLVAADPLAEASYVLQMRLHALHGDRASVRRAYETCLIVLQRELDVAPAPATQAAYQHYLQLEPATPLRPVVQEATGSASTQIAAPAAPPTVQPVRARPLPVPTTPFLGREQELAQVAEQLADPACRLLTVMGPGGVGKTRLALQIAAGHQAVFADGVVYVALASVESGAHMASALASALAATGLVSFSDVAGMDGQLLDYLRTKSMLLVLDNFEQLAGEADFLAELLAEAPGCKVVVTSRQRLDLVEEWVYELQGLPVPDGDNWQEGTAIALFEQSARRSHHQFVLSEENHAAIVEICQAVGGMPLAIELAASWVRLLSCAEIAAEIARTFDFLAGTQRNLPERHRSLRAVFDHSWRLLSDEERGVLSALAVFPSGFSRDAAQAVAGSGLAMLSALSAKSLLERIEPGRYSLHELVRQYAHEKLDESRQCAEIHDRLLNYYLGLALEAQAALYGPDQRQWLERLEQEHDNLRSALEWAFGDEQNAGDLRVAQGLQLVAVLDRFWNGRGHLVEGRAWAELGLSKSAGAPPAIRAKALNLLGWLVNILGDSELARAHQLESLALYRASGDLTGMADALDSLGDIAWVQGHVAAAQAYYAECLAVRRQLNDAAAVGLSLYSLGRLEVDHGHADVALPLLEEALELLQRVQDRRGAALTFNALGRAELRRGDYTAAERNVRSALRIFGELGNIVDIPECLEELATAAAAMARPVRAAVLLGGAGALRKVTGAYPSLDSERIAVLLNRVLGDPRLAQAHQRGAAYSLAQMLAYALAEPA